VSDPKPQLSPEFLDTYAEQTLRKITEAEELAVQAFNLDALIKLFDLRVRLLTLLFNR
jgi:hypothetical protein